MVEETKGGDNGGGGDSSSVVGGCNIGSGGVVEVAVATAVVEGWSCSLQQGWWRQRWCERSSGGGGRPHVVILITYKLSYYNVATVIFTLSF